MALPKDTSPDAWARQIAGIRAMSPQERLQLATSMSDDVRALARDGIRARHPEWNVDEVATALEDLVLGSSLARTVRASRSLPTR